MEGKYKIDVLINACQRYGKKSFNEPFVTASDLVYLNVLHKERKRGLCFGSGT